MDTLEALLSEIVADPVEEMRWLVLADWLEEFDDPRRGELLRLHRKMLATCCEPEAHPDRAIWQSRIVTLINEGVQPCVPQKTLTLPGNVPMTFTFIPPGRFQMGSNDPESFDSERPVHPVTLTKGFFLGVHLVTQAEWTAVMGTNPSYFKWPSRPVEQVSWDDCQVFCRELTARMQERFPVRLPTEAEWEYACRAGTTTPFWFGDTVKTYHVNYNGKYPYENGKKNKKGINLRMTTVVGSFLSNGWGLFDMHGNVWEWCADSDGAYPQSEVVDPQGPVDGESRAMRGGSFLVRASTVRSAFRTADRPSYRKFFLGFRVAMTL